MSGEWVFLLVLGALIVGGWFGVACERVHARIRANRVWVNTDNDPDHGYDIHGPGGYWRSLH